MARAAVDCEAGETNGSLYVLLQQEGPPVADADDGFVRSAAFNAANPDRAEPCESGGCGDPLGGPGGRGRVAPSEDLLRTTDRPNAVWPRSGPDFAEVPVPAQSWDSAEYLSSRTASNLDAGPRRAATPRPQAVAPPQLDPAPAVQP